MTFINQYSIVWSGVILFGLVAFLLLRKGYTTQRILIILGLGAILITGWLIIRPDPPSTNDFDAFQSEIGNGQTVLLELQSPF
jgi:hypothetical protein